MQLIQDETGQALTWILMVGAGILIAGYAGLGTQLTSVQGEARTQATLDLAVLHSSLAQILKDSTFCANTLNQGKGGPTYSIGGALPSSVALTQVAPGTGVGSTVFINKVVTSPASTFNSLKITGISLNLLTLTAGQYTGNFHVDVNMPTHSFGSNTSSIDVPISISGSSPPFACTGGP